MRVLTLLSCVLSFAQAAMGQGVSVEIEMDQRYYLPHEALIVKVKVTNYSGQALRLGNEPDWLSFDIEGRNSRNVSSLAPVPVSGDYSLDSSKVGIKPVDIAPYFDLSQPDHYKITAIVNIPQWRQAIKSQPAKFDIITGTKLWSQDFGVPPPPGSVGARPEMRQYTLIQTIHQRRLMLYFRVSALGGAKVLRVFPIGPMVSFSRPEPQLDKYSNIHILYQTGARRFTHSVINPDGLLIAREFHDYTNSRPALHAESDGRIVVNGGVRKITLNDLPPPSRSALLSEDSPATR